MLSRFRSRDMMDLTTLTSLVVTFTLSYAAWLTSIVFCAVNGKRPLMIASAAVFPVGVVHGLGVWFGGW